MKRRRRKLRNTKKSRKKLRQQGKLITREDRRILRMFEEWEKVRKLIENRKLKNLKKKKDL